MRQGNIIRQCQSVLVLALAACAPQTKKHKTSEATAELALSSAARQKGDQAAALKHAQRAIALNPEMVNAHFAAAEIASDMCVPNALPRPNVRECNLALEEYTRVVQLDPSHEEALKHLAYLLWQLGRDGSEAYYRKALSLNANDPEVLAGIAAIDWRQSRDEVRQPGAEAGIPAGRPSIGSPWCAELRRNHIDRVNEGISLLTKALQVQGGNAGLMAWLSQFYDTRAEMHAPTPRHIVRTRVRPSCGPVWRTTRGSRTMITRVDFLLRHRRSPQRSNGRHCTLTLV